MCLINEIYHCGQGVRYSMIDGKCVEAGAADVSYIKTCPCDECKQLRKANGEKELRSE